MAARRLIQGTKEHRAYVWGGWALGLLGLILIPFIRLPWIFGERVGQLNNWCLAVAYAVAILGLNLLIGFSGQISIGHSAFIGLGAFATVITVKDHNWSFFTALPFVFVLCFVVGCVIGLPALRIQGIGLVVVTFALGITFPTLILKYESLTGGANGKGVRDPISPPTWTPFDPSDRVQPVQYRYFVELIVAAIMFILARNILKSRAGRAMVAQRDNPTAAAVNGISVPINKVIIFGLSAGFCGVAGWLLMINTPFASDASFGVALSVTLIVGLVLGGVATVSGALPGAFIVTIVAFLLQRLTDSKKIGSFHLDFMSNRPGRGGVVDMVFGALLILFVFVLPGGMIDGLRRLRAKFVTVVPRPAWLAQVQKPSTSELDMTEMAVPAMAENAVAS